MKNHDENNILILIQQQKITELLLISSQRFLINWFSINNFNKIYINDRLLKKFNLKHTGFQNLKLNISGNVGDCGFDKKKGPR